MKKKRILLASVLKPINDTRMYEKLGLSLGKLPAIEIHIAGFKATEPQQPGIFFYNLFNNQRISWQRLLVSFRFLKLLFRLKPHVVIICTPELLPAALIYKSIGNYQLIYDIQENYHLNITTQSVYPAFIRSILAGAVRLVEKLADPFVHTFFLAEKSYAAELPFLKNKYLILENKYKPTPEAPATIPNNSVKLPSDTIQLLYSGTISELYGILEAINLSIQLHQLDNRIRLLIIGFCPQESVLQKVKAIIKDKPFITLVGGGQLVPHPQIIQAIRSSHFGLLPYHLHPSLSRCVPTRLFEYLANQLPVIIQQNPYWQSYIQENNAGIEINFNQFNPAKILTQITTHTFYTAPKTPDVFWQNEEDKLLAWAKSTILPD